MVRNGDGRQVAADFLQHHAGLYMAKTQPAIIFGYENAGKAHFGKLLPQGVAETVLALPVAKLAQMADRRFGAHELARAVVQHGLVFVEI